MNTRSSKLIPVVAALAAVICGVVRFFQIVSLTDYSTGFFIDGAGFGGILIYILLVGMIAALAALAFVGRKKGSDAAYSLSPDGMGQNATRFLGASEVLAALLIGVRVTEGGSVVMLAATVIAAAALIVSGFTLVGRIVPPKFTGHLKIVAALYMFMRLGEYFNSYLIMRHNAEKLIVIFSYWLVIVFLGFLARFYARLETKDSRLAGIIFSLSTFIFSAAHAISDILAKLFGGAGAAAFVNLNYDACAAAVLSGTYLFVMYFTSKTKDYEPIVVE